MQYTTIMQNQEHWRRLLLRTDKTAAAYEAAIAEGKPEGGCRLCSDKEAVLQEFEHWFLMDNRFPYDRYFSKSHMLVSKRHVKEADLNEAEKAEFQDLRNGYLSEHYDSILDHLPKQKSLPNHCHMHLIEVRRHDGLAR